MLGDFKQNARDRLDDLAFAALSSDSPSIRFGGGVAYVGGSVLTELVPETGLELLPEIGQAVGTLAKLARGFRGAEDILQASRVVDEPPQFRTEPPARSMLSPDEFLSANGVADPALRQQLIDSGIRTDLLDPNVTPTTLARFDKLFVQTFDEGKSFSGRLGNIDTRVSTINKAAELERSGLDPAFEFPVDVGGGKTRYVDLVGLNPETQQNTAFYQFVKENSAGVVIRPDELLAAQQAERALKLPSGTVQLINTKR